MMVAKRGSGTIEIRDVDDLLRVAREARDAEAPLVLQTDGGDEIVVDPARRRSGRPGPTSEEWSRADEAAFGAAAGGWDGLVDGDALKREIRAGRGSKRPPVDLTPLEE